MKSTFCNLNIAGTCSRFYSQYYSNIVKCNNIVYSETVSHNTVYLQKHQVSAHTLEPNFLAISASYMSSDHCKLLKIIILLSECLCYDVVEELSGKYSNLLFVNHKNNN